MTRDWDGERARREDRERAAKYVVMIHFGHHYSTLGTYESGHWQWNPVGDGFSQVLSNSGFATLADATRECDLAADRCGLESAPFVVELPIRVNGETGLLDPDVSRVYTATLP